MAIGAKWSTSIRAAAPGLQVYPQAVPTSISVPRLGMQSPHCDHGSVLAHSCCYRAALDSYIVHVLHPAWLRRRSALWGGRRPSPPGTLRSIEEA